MLNKVFIFSLFLILSSQVFCQSDYNFEVSSINFYGNNSFSSSDLEGNIESKVSPWWFWVFVNSFTSFGDEAVYFDSSNITIDKQALKDFYQANGFFDVKVSSRVDVDSTDKSVDINYFINEGKQTSFGKLNIFGINKLSGFDRGKLYSESIDIDSTKTFSESEVQSNISAVKRFLINNGYPFGKYDSTLIEVDTVKLRADVDLYFTTGKKYNISETIINKTGKSIDQITNKLITEIADLKPGTIFSQAQIDRSELRLLKTDLFNSLDISPVFSDTTDHKIPIEINTSIGSLNELSPEIKADNEFNFFNAGLGLTYTRKNFFGDARKLNISTSFRLIDILHIDFGNIFKSSVNRDSTYQGVFDLNLQMEQPFLFGKPILTTTEIYFRSQTFTEFTENSYGAAQKFDFEMPAHTFITLLRPYISVDVAERDNLIRVATNDTLSHTTKSVTPGLGVELGSSKTNDLQFPTKGSYLFFTPELFRSSTTISNALKIANSPTGVENSSTTASTYFYRLQLGLSNFLSVSRNQTAVFATKIRLGYIQPFIPSSDSLATAQQLIPPNKTFYAGGSNSVRGWKARELVPTEKITYAGQTTETNAIRGGTFWMEGSFEFRKRLHEYFGFAFFADYGNTWNGWKEMQIKDIAVSLGFGIRIYTPIAPFRLDFGTKFYNPKNQKMIFGKHFFDNVTVQFGIGEAF